MTDKHVSDQLERRRFEQSDAAHHGFLAKAAEIGFSEEEVEKLCSIYGAPNRRNSK